MFLGHSRSSPPSFSAPPHRKSQLRPAGRWNATTVELGPHSHQVHRTIGCENDNTALMHPLGRLIKTPGGFIKPPLTGAVRLRCLFRAARGATQGGRANAGVGLFIATAIFPLPPWPWNECDKWRALFQRRPFHLRQQSWREKLGSVREKKKKRKEKCHFCPGWLLFSYEITIPLSPREIIDRHGNNGRGRRA